MAGGNNISRLLHILWLLAYISFASVSNGLLPSYFYQKWISICMRCPYLIARAQKWSNHFVLESNWCKMSARCFLKCTSKSCTLLIRWWGCPWLEVKIYTDKMFGQAGSKAKMFWFRNNLPLAKQELNWSSKIVSFIHVTHCRRRHSQITTPIYNHISMCTIRHEWASYYALQWEWWRRKKKQRARLLIAAIQSLWRLRTFGNYF